MSHKWACAGRIGGWGRASGFGVELRLQFEPGAPFHHLTGAESHEYSEDVAVALWNP